MLAALSLAALPSIARADWSQPSGGALDVTPAANVGFPSIANVGGVPYVTWPERSGGRDQVFVKRLEGTTWVQVGGSLNIDPTEDAISADIASVGGVPYVAWLESNGTREELYVKRWTGTAWTLLGLGALNRDAQADASDPSIAGALGVPYVAWSEAPPGGHPQVFVDHFIGGDWGLVGGRALNESVTDDARTSRLADVGGVAYVVWSESGGGRTLVHADRFDGIAFAAVPGDPLNVDAARDAVVPSIAAVNGVPYVAWTESDGFADQVYVKRLEATDWARVGGSLNVDPADDADAPTIASVGGAPAVVWQEQNGAVNQIRFSRFDGTSWRAVGGPLNVDPSHDAQFSDPSLIDIGGVPYVAWSEANPVLGDVRVKRLEPDILSESAAASAGGVTLTAELDDFGVPLPVGFDYGVGAFALQTPLALSSGTGFSNVTVAIGGLQPGTSYVYRAFGSDTLRETSTGETQSFITPAVPGGGPTGVPGRPTPGRITGLLLSPPIFFAARRGASTAARSVGALVSYVDSEPATTTFTVQRAGAGRRAGGRCVASARRNRGRARCTRYVSVGSFAHADAAGANRFRFTGRVGGRTLAPGRYRLQAIPTNSAGRGLPAYRNFEVKR